MKTPKRCLRYLRKLGYNSSSEPAWRWNKFENIQNWTESGSIMEAHCQHSTLNYQKLFNSALILQLEDQSSQTTLLTKSSKWTNLFIQGASDINLYLSLRAWETPASIASEERLGIRNDCKWQWSIIYVLLHVRTDIESMTSGTGQFWQTTKTSYTCRRTCHDILSNTYYSKLIM